MQRVLTGLGVGSADATAAGAITRGSFGTAPEWSAAALHEPQPDVFGADVPLALLADAIVDLGILSEMVQAPLRPAVCT